MRLGWNGGSGFDEAFLEDFFVGEPEVGDVGGAEAENVFEGAADFGEAEIDADAIEEIEKRLSAFGEQRPGADAGAIEAVIGKNVNGARAGAVANDVKKAPGLGKGCGWSQCRAGCRGAHRVAGLPPRMELLKEDIDELWRTLSTGSATVQAKLQKAAFHGSGNIL